jgi:hypothetical protein
MGSPTGLSYRPGVVELTAKAAPGPVIKSTNTPYLSNLPNEVLAGILSPLDPADLACLASTCRWLSDAHAGPRL